MNDQNSNSTVKNTTLSSTVQSSNVKVPEYDKDRIEDIGFLTAMTLVLMGN